LNSKPELFNRLEPFFLEREVSLRKNGYHIFSHFIGSPVIGGWSWLADATLLTGIRIDSQQKYKALLQSNAPSLPCTGNGSRLMGRGKIVLWF
jgi:hypothetical protein